MSRWKLRSQIAAVAGVSILLGVIVLGVALQLLLARDLRSQLDRTLRQRAADVATLSATAPALLTSPGALDSSATSGPILVEVVDRRNGIVARSLSLGAGALPADSLARQVIGDGRPRYADATLGDRGVRIYAAPLSRIGGGAAAGGAVVVASTTQQTDDTLARLRRLDAAGGRGCRRDRGGSGAGDHPPRAATGRAAVGRCRPDRRHRRPVAAGDPAAGRRRSRGWRSR